MHIITSKPKGFISHASLFDFALYKNLKGINIIMAKHVVPDAKDALNRFKMEAASEVGVNLKNGYNGDLTSRQAGSVGGQMVKKMIESYENSIKTR